MGFTAFGEILILLAFAFNFVGGVAFLVTARGYAAYESLARRAYALLTLTVTLAVAYLFYLFLSHNFAIRYVHDYSSRSLEFFYVLSAFWGGQEGTYLLWLFFSVLLGFLIIKYGGQYRDYAMTIYATVNAFLLFILIKLSPFAATPFSVTDGAGLNPLLQDPWMVIHPPVMFVGYAMAAVPFAIVIGALLKGEYSNWLQRAFPWAAATALFLGAGNILGAYWAYRTLGWGGYWAWDPVENSSFIPWMVSLALLHGLIIQRSSGALHRINMMLVSFLFILVIYGTFLTRSGVLADFSVHSFVDLGTNIYLILFLLFFVVLTIVLLLWRARSIPTAPLDYNLWGKQFMLFASTCMIFLLAVVILFWTSLPVLTTYFTSEPRAANPETYNGMALPLALLMALLLTMSPFAGGGQYRLRNWLLKLIGVTVSSVAIALLLFWLGPNVGWDFVIAFSVFSVGLAMFLMKPGMARKLLPGLIGFVVSLIAALFLGVEDYLYLLFFATATMAVVTGVYEIVVLLPSRWRLLGGRLTHFGFGLMLIGVLASSAFSTGQKLLLTKGGTGEAFGMMITYKGMADDIMKPKNELILDIDEDGVVREIRPQLYYSSRLNGIMRRPRIMSSLTYDYYFAPEQIETPPEDPGLRLAKGDTVRVGERLVRFDGFETSSHGEGGGMSVSARLIVEHDGITDTLRPTTGIITTNDGKTEPQDLPAFLDDDPERPISLRRVLADQGEIILDWPDAKDRNSEERLALDISRKPLIGMVWAGTVLMIIGSGFTYVRRRSEIPK